MPRPLDPEGRDRLIHADLPDVDPIELIVEADRLAGPTALPRLLARAAATIARREAEIEHLRAVASEVMLDMVNAELRRPSPSHPNRG